MRVPTYLFAYATLFIVSYNKWVCACLQAGRLLGRLGSKAFGGLPFLALASGAAQVNDDGEGERESTVLSFFVYLFRARKNCSERKMLQT